MAFSLFTKASNRISNRLRWLGRGFQLWGGLTAAATLAAFVFFATMPSFLKRVPVETRAVLGLRLFVLGAVGSTSLYLIGRSLLRRQRSGLYGAAIIVVAPLVLRATVGARFTFGVPDLGFGLAAVALIASVWKEVHEDAVELENPDDPDDDSLPLTPRNRGFGEPRQLPSERLTGELTSRKTSEETRERRNA